jgi:hypothetical protein
MSSISTCMPASARSGVCFEEGLYVMVSILKRKDAKNAKF